MNAVLLLLTACALQAQSFDAATVKPTSGFGPDGRVIVGMLPPAGGPGTDDPGRIRYPAITLKRLLLIAYNVDDTKIRTADWLDHEFFQVEAVMLPGTTGEQFRVMLQNLLSDRFKLTTHRETLVATGYSLMVGKNGPTGALKQSNAALASPDQNWTARKGRDGFVLPRKGQMFFIQTGPLRSRFSYQHAPMRVLAGSLTGLLGAPVEDATGLTGEYDFALTFHPGGTLLENGPLAGVAWPAADRQSAADAEALPDVFGAVQMLGLKVQRQKASTDVIVVDHIERRPSEN
jgi:uncharacterized protein (TIGR03435 family)